MDNLTLEMRDTRGPETDALIAGVRHFNAQQVGTGDPQALVVTLRDADGQWVAGVSGRTVYRHFLIDVLWVAPEYRSSGLGRRVMERAEAEARLRGCVAAQVDTLSFQAPEFYRRLGFEDFGRIDDYPAGHARHFMIKHYTRPRETIGVDTSR